MQRIKRFVTNVRFAGLIKCVMLGVLLGLGFRQRHAQVDVLAGSVMLGIGLVAPYFVRRWLVRGWRTKLLLLNGLLVLALGAMLLALRGPTGLEMYFRMAGAGLIGLYLGSYFWMMSDAQVKVYDASPDGDDSRES